MSLFGYGSKKITPVEHSTLLQAFQTNIFGTLKNPPPGFTHVPFVAPSPKTVRLCND